MVKEAVDLLHKLKGRKGGIRIAAACEQPSPSPSAYD